MIWWTNSIGLSMYKWCPTFGTTLTLVAMPVRTWSSSKHCRAIVSFGRIQSCEPYSTLTHCNPWLVSRRCANNSCSGSRADTPMALYVFFFRGTGVGSDNNDVGARRSIESFSPCSFEKRNDGMASDTGTVPFTSHDDIGVSCIVDALGIDAGRCCGNTTDSSRSATVAEDGCVGANVTRVGSNNAFMANSPDGSATVIWYK